MSNYQLLLGPRTAGRFIPPAELSKIACDARAEGDERALRLIDHIQVLQAALTMRAGREEDAGVVAGGDDTATLATVRIELERLPAPGQVHARVESRVPDDPAAVGRRR